MSDKPLLKNDGSPEWREQVARMERHIARLDDIERRADRVGYRCYMDNLRTTEGQAAVDLVKGVRKYRRDTAEAEAAK